MFSLPQTKHLCGLCTKVDRLNSFIMSFFTQEAASPWFINGNEGFIFVPDCLYRKGSRMNTLQCSNSPGYVLGYY